MIKLSGISTFQWSTSEQVWPFEKNRAGETLYCKEIDCGNLPNSSEKTVSHGISNLGTKLFSSQMYVRDSYSQTLVIPHGAPSTAINYYFSNTTIRINTTDNRSDNTGIVRVIYSK